MVGGRRQPAVLRERAEWRLWTFEVPRVSGEGVDVGEGERVMGSLSVFEADDEGAPGGVVEGNPDDEELLGQ